MLRQGPQKLAAAHSLGLAPPSRDDHLPEEINAAHGDASARRLQQTASPSPLVHRADADADQVQEAGRNDKADAVEQSAFAGRQLGAVGGVAVEQREHADKRRRGKERRTPMDSKTAAPSRRADMAMPTSTPGNGTPISPRKPPNAITIGNVTGRSQMAGARAAPPKTDGDHRQDIIQPGDRVLETVEKSSSFACDDVSARRDRQRARHRREPPSRHVSAILPSPAMRFRLLVEAPMQWTIPRFVIARSRV